MSDVEVTKYTIATGTRIRLNGFHGYRQAAGTWCWAATAASISHYYRKLMKFPTSIPQCYFVSLQHPGPACRRKLDAKLFREFCVIDCASNGCAIDDKPELGRARAALNTPGLEVFHNTFNKPISFMRIRQQIRNGYPIAIRVRNRNGTHHLFAIYGYDVSVPSLIMWDPAVGERIVGVNALQKTLGRWTHTIVTHRPEYPELYEPVWI